MKLHTNNPIVTGISTISSTVSNFVGDVMEVTPLTKSIKTYGKVAVRVGMYPLNTAVAMDDKFMEYSWWSESANSDIYTNAVDLSQKDLSTALDWAVEAFKVDEKKKKKSKKKKVTSKKKKVTSSDKKKILLLKEKMEA